MNRTRRSLGAVGWIVLLGVCVLWGCDDDDSSNPPNTQADTSGSTADTTPDDTTPDTLTTPADSTTAADSDADLPTCGNGLIDPGERCDLGIADGEAGGCPVACEPVLGCTAFALVGSGCNRHCESAPILACDDNDGCCPSTCNPNSDNDCSDTCGNGTLDPDELCDGDCPTSCDATPATCERFQLVGDISTCSARCESTPVTTCTDADGCCPSICNASTDADCVVPLTCGNGQPDEGELCDGDDCPTSCTPTNACEPLELIGSAQTCDAECVSSGPITECGSGDGCCPTGCDSNSDADCRAPWSCAPSLLLLGGYDDIQGLNNDPLRQALAVRIGNHNNLGYNLARDYMFNQFDVNANNQIECIYTGRLVTPDGTRTPGSFNTEHSWPRNDAAGDSTAASEPAEADLHHLYPTDDTANNRRASFDYGWTDCGTSGEPSCDWTVGDSQLGDVRGGNASVFEVRLKYRGDVARSHFYFAVRYARPIPAAEEAALREWHCQDPPDDVERARNEAIFALQNNRNPFVDRPDFVDYISDF